MDTLSLPITQQPRLVLFLPAALVLSGVVGASLVGVLINALTGSRSAAAAAAVICLLLGIALAIGSSTGNQGTVRVVAGAALEVDARWRSAQQLDLSEAVARRFVWRRGQVRMLVGVYLELADRHGRVTIGSSDPGLAEPFAAAGAESTTVPPSVVLAPADFRRLLSVLPRQLPAEREL